MSDEHTCDWCGCTCRATDYDALAARLAEANERAGKLNRQLVELQDAIDSRDKAAGFEEVPCPDGSRVLCVKEEVPALSPEARQAFRAAVQEIDGVNLRENELLRARLEDLRNALDWIADPKGNDICTPQEIAEHALAKDAARAGDTGEKT